MYFSFPCPHCGKKLKVQEEAAGRRAACPYCKHSVTVPEPPAESEPSPSDGIEAFKGIGESVPTTSVAQRTRGKKPPVRHARQSSSRSSWADRTDVSVVTSGLLAVVFTVVFYVALWMAWIGWEAVFPPQDAKAPKAAAAKTTAERAGSEEKQAGPPPQFYFGELFVHRGWVPFVEVFMLMWSVAILLFKSRKLKRQKTSMLFDLLPTDIGQEITEDNADQFIKHIHDLPVEPSTSFLVNRVLRGLEHFRVRRSNPEAAAMLASQSEIDGNAVQSSYTLINVLVWAIPILGFIGTVIGISAAVGAFSGTLSGAGDIDQLKGALNNVTTGLATAFDTTLLALLMSMIVMFPSSSLQKSEEDLLNWVDEYCNENLLKRLRDGALGGDGPQRSDVSPAVLRRAIDAAMVPHHAELESWRAKLEALGESLSDRIVEGYERVHEQLQERQDETAEQVEDLEVIAGAFQQTLTELTQQTQQVHEQAAESMRQSAESLRAWCTALEQGLGGLNGVLAELGEKQVVVQAAPRRRWLFWRNHKD